jgi:hypothetical protein
MRWSRAALFFLTKMSQDAIDNVLALNTGDDFYRSNTAIANFNVDIE